MNDASGVERTAQLEKAVLQSLDHLERGDADAARDELLRVAPATAPAPIGDAISDQELEAAFAGAAAEVDQMLDADGVVEAAIQAADRSPLDDEEEPLAHQVGEQFATATMAELLAEQGDEDAALEIRAALSPAAVPNSDAYFDDAPDAAAPGPTEQSAGPRDRVVRTLENWLDNLRGGART